MKYGVTKAYSGYINDKNILKNSASGGFAYALAYNFIKKGNIVHSVRYSSDFRQGEWARVTTIEALTQFQGSKYVESRKVYEGFNLYESLKQDLQAGLKVLAIGLPCDIGAIKSYLKKDYQNLYCVDLICHGPTTKKVADDYLTALEKKFKSQLTDFSVRYKRYGKWMPIYLRAEFKNGEVYMKPFYDTDYGIAFSILSRSVCYNCKFKSINHKSDITIGDYWGLTNENQKEWNDMGVSVAFVRTEKGERLIDCIKDLCTINETDMDFAIQNNQLINEQKIKDKHYPILAENLNKYDLHEAIKKTFSLQERIVYAGKKAIKAILPRKFIIFVRKHLNHMKASF